MSVLIRQQLAALDRGLLALAGERARLCAQLAAGGLAELETLGAVGIDDLLRRDRGPLSAAAVRALMQLVEESTRDAARRGSSQGSPPSPLRIEP